MVKLALVALLQGAFISATGAMRSDLATRGLLPVDSATAYPTNFPDPNDESLLLYPGMIQASLPNINSVLYNGKRVVDWVVVQLRSQYEVHEVIVSKACVMLTDGSIVNPDGSPVSFEVALGSYHVSVCHRNHITIATAAEIAFNGEVAAHDFTSSLTAFMDNGSGNASATLSTGKYGMWACDVYRDQFVDSNDLSLINAGISANLTNVYNSKDVTLEGDCTVEDRTLYNANAAQSPMGALVA